MSDTPNPSTSEANEDITTVRLPADTEVVRLNGLLVGFAVPGPGSSWRAWDTNVSVEVLVDGPADRSKNRAARHLVDELRIRGMLP